jgi:TetR/AcrR family transcriptional repressor of nem operon
VAVAAAKFSEGGLEKTGLTEIMHGAGMTHGGFYKHFESKEQLVEESLALAFERTHLSLQQPKAKSSLQGTLGEYLSKSHRDDSSLACPLPSLGSELSNAGDTVKEIASAGVSKLIAQVRDQLPDLSPRESRKRANATVAAMVGAMMLSRLVTDPSLSDSLLKDTKDFLLDR